MSYVKTYKFTSQECCACGTRVEKDLTERNHNCFNCGLSIDRDLNAAINILDRATAGQAGRNASGNEPLGSFMKEEVQTTNERRG